MPVLQLQATKTDQLRCLARRLPKYLTNEELDALPLDLLLFFNPPSRWSVSTLNALQGLLTVLDESIIHSIPKDVKAEWLQHISRGPSWRGIKLTAMIPRFRRDTERKACPPGMEPHKVDENLIFYQNWELEACVDGAMLATQMDLVNEIPFTYEQLDIFKHKLDETYPQGYPESLIQQLGHFFRYISPEDIHRWNVSSPDTVKTLLKVTKGQKMDAQVTSTPEDMWLDEGMLLSLPQGALVASSIGGASVEDLRALSQQNLSMDLATFKKLQVDALVGLTVAEVQKLLGPHIADLKTEEDKSPVRDWLFQQRQEDLDRLGLGLQGGIPNGYLILDLNVRGELGCPGAELGDGFRSLICLLSLQRPSPVEPHFLDQDL
ncbi:mesothelin [Cricetulus griseus]